MYAIEAYSRLKSRLAIDKLRVEDELMETPSMVQEAAEHTGEAIQIRDALKHALDIATAEGMRELRLGEEKLSDKKMEAEVMLLPSVQEAQVALEDAKRDAFIWSALCDSMRDKSSALRRIAEMIVSGYMTSSSVYAERKQEMNDKRKEGGGPERFKRRPV